MILDPAFLLSLPSKPFILKIIEILQGPNFIPRNPLQNSNKLLIAHRIYFRIQIADPEYKKAFDDELAGFKDRIMRRAKEKIAGKAQEMRAGRKRRAEEKKEGRGRRRESLREEGGA